MWILLALGQRLALARAESSVMIMGPAIAAALQAVSSAPWMAPTFSGPNMSARKAGMVANPPPVHAENHRRAPLGMQSSPHVQRVAGIT